MSVRSLSITPEEWHADMVRKLFQNKANFRRERRLCSATYNGRSASMRAKGLNAVTVQEARGRPTNESEGRRANVARELNAIAAESCILGFYGPKR